MLIRYVENILALAAMPFLLMGLVQRVKALWSGRKGPPILQPAYDVLRLFRKARVLSTVSTPVFRISPYVWLLTALSSATVVPLLGAAPLLAFPFDFVWLAYAWGLGRVAMMLAALDTGSSFEGMGAAREATFSALLEPVLFLVTGALCFVTHSHTLHEALLPQLAGGGFIVWLLAIVALLIVLQVETARMPVDDPATHLELTMVHEVMVLDHSGPDLAVIQWGAAIKFFIGSAFIATLLNPWAGQQSALAAATNLALCALIAVVIGTIESLIARLKLRAVPRYVGVAVLAGTIAAIATTWRAGASP